LSLLCRPIDRDLTEQERESQAEETGAKNDERDDSWTSLRPCVCQAPYGRAGTMEGSSFCQPRCITFDHEALDRSLLLLKPLQVFGAVHEVRAGPEGDNVSRMRFKGGASWRLLDLYDVAAAQHHAHSQSSQRVKRPAAAAGAVSQLTSPAGGPSVCSVLTNGREDTMRDTVSTGALLLSAVVLFVSACATAPRAPSGPDGLPKSFESDHFVVTFAKRGDTAESLASRYLGDPARAWIIQDYTGARTFSEGQEVIIPKRDLNPSGVQPSGYQLVPILVYHDVGIQPRGRLLIAAAKFEEQMRYLKTEGYRTVSLQEFLEYTNLGRQLPRKSVVLTFDDGYKSFRRHAAPVLKELGFTATLFVYTDYIGVGRNALSWQDLRELLAEGFDVQTHSKTHGDLRRAVGEPQSQYGLRMQAELGQPLALFRQHLGRRSDALAYPHGYVDEELSRQVREYGYRAAFTVRRQANPAFVSPLRINRSQIYADMSLEEFARNLTEFHHENLR
jgi:peptidoglycan/xylan/chitin deacetylase (PgdA/CDA1 family)